MRLLLPSPSPLALLLSTLPFTTAFFRMPCVDPVTVERLDPIATPGQLATHEHTVMGSNAFNATMSFADSQLATCSTCKVKFDRSNYWTPTLYFVSQKDGSVKPVEQTGGMLAYYLLRRDERDQDGGELFAFPEGFKMIAGDKDRRTFTEGKLDDEAVSFACLDFGKPEGQGNPETPDLPPYNCPNGLRTQVFFPACWDGENLDAEDHKSHVAYPDGMNNGVCPESHPKRLVSLFYEVMWNVNEFKDEWWEGPDGRGHPFVLSTGDTSGYSFHGDFHNGWDVDALQRAVNVCDAQSGQIEDCPVFEGEIWDDETLNGCRVPKTTSDPDRRTAGILPGCIPVGGDGEVAGGDCEGEEGVMTEPDWGFTDMTAEGFRYVGCATEPNGQGRTLNDESEAEDDMTIDKCVSFCKEGGFKFAGLEYGRECFCGNRVTKDRMPRTDGVMGGCDMPCAGNELQSCGGPSRLSLYEACGDGECRNAEFSVFGRY